VKTQVEVEINRLSKESNEEKIKQILQQLQTQRKKWHDRNALCWSFYYVNYNSKVNLDVPQMMCCYCVIFNLLFL
jgi:hypothetical protein